MTLRSIYVIGLAAVLLASCTYAGGDIGNALVRKAHWFSYVEGDDIRATCAPGSPERVRAVYNGLWDQQLRMYEVDSVRRLLVVRVTRDMAARRFSLDNPLGPWDAAEERVQLDDATWQRLGAAFAASGMYDPPPVGLELPARSYFWTAAYCYDGRYGFTAWKYPSPEFDRLTFDGVLFPLDPTGVAVAKPGPVPLDIIWENDRRNGRVTDFTLKVGPGGLVR